MVGKRTSVAERELVARTVIDGGVMESVSDSRSDLEDEADGVKKLLDLVVVGVGMRVRVGVGGSVFVAVEVFVRINGSLTEFDVVGDPAEFVTD